MILSVEIAGKTVRFDTSKPIDISIPIHAKGPRAWYVSEARIAPVINRFFTGSVALGGSVNFNDIFFNPHGHGTHTECVGHITRANHSVNEALTEFFYQTRLISVALEILSDDTTYGKKGDRYISRKAMEQVLGEHYPESVVVRTLPNDRSKLTMNYSNTNFPYFEPAALALLAERGVKHLLTDLPSVDREEDGGLLLAHRAFWFSGGIMRSDSTITEFVYVPDHILDGAYLLELQVAAFANDASPSRPLLYEGMIAV